MATITKKRAVKNAISDTTVDSTLPVETLIKDFVNPQKILSMFCRRIVTKSPVRDMHNEPHYLQPGHPLNAFHQDWDGVLPSNLYEPLGYKSTMPSIMTNARNNDKNDPLLQHMKIKWEWKSIVTDLGKIAVYHTKNYIPLTMDNEKVWHCPKSAADLAVMMEEDPFPLFDSYYNWHYAGNGNMQLLSVGEEDCILHSELCRLYLSKFSRRRIRVKHKYIFSYDCGEGNNILETICNAQHIALRFMNKVLLLRLIVRDGAINVKREKEIDYKAIVTSISFDPHQRNILYITRVDNTTTIVNLEVMKGRTLNLPETSSLVNNWGTVVGVDADTFCHVGRETVTIYDKRTNDTVHTWSEALNALEMCDKFSVVRKCDDSPFMYIGTRHHLFLADMRLKTKFIQRWNPMTYCEPTYISMCKMENGKDLVCLSSQWPEDTCVIANNTEIIMRKGYSKHLSLPYQLPSIEQILLEARQKRLCLDPYNPISRRLYGAVTGSAVALADDKYLVLTQNGLGDIFCNTLYPDYSEVEDDSVERLHEWSKTLKDLSKTLNVTAVIDIAGVWKTLKQVPKEHVIGCEKVFPHLPLAFSEKEAIDAFESDEVDKGLLAAWNVEDEPPIPVSLDFSDCE